MSSYKLAMLGDYLSSKIFKALGIDVYDIKDDSEQLDEMRKTLARWIRSNEYGAIFITEKYAEPLEDIIKEHSYSYLPSIILIPEVRGSRGLAESIVRETLKKAAGIDIMGDSDNNQMEDK